MSKGGGGFAALGGAPVTPPIGTPTLTFQNVAYGSTIGTMVGNANFIYNNSGSTAFEFQVGFPTTSPLLYLRDTPTGFDQGFLGDTNSPTGTFITVNSNGDLYMQGNGGTMLAFSRHVYNIGDPDGVYSNSYFNITELNNFSYYSTIVSVGQPFFVADTNSYIYIIGDLNGVALGNYMEIDDGSQSFFGNTYYSTIGRLDNNGVGLTAKFVLGSLKDLENNSYYGSFCVINNDALVRPSMSVNGVSYDATNGINSILFHEADATTTTPLYFKVTGTCYNDGDPNFFVQIQTNNNGTVTQNSYIRATPYNFKYQGNTSNCYLSIDDLTGLLAISKVPFYASDALAISAGLTSGQLYKTTDPKEGTLLKIVP